MSKDSFDYTYSAKENEQLQKIKDKYRGKTVKETKMEKLVALDKSTTKNATKVAIALGGSGTLIFGIGITCVTTWTDYFMAGVIIGCIGLIILGGAYPVYLEMVKRKREIIMPQILELTEEIEKGEYYYEEK